MNRPEPLGVHVKRNGERVDVATMFIGVDAEGQDVYEVLDTLVPGDTLHVDVLPAGCRVIIHGPTPTQTAPKEAM